MKKLTLILLIGSCLLAAQVSLVRPPQVIPVPPPPIMHVETIALNTLSAGSTTYTYTLLSKVPITSMGCIIAFNSSQTGGSLTTATTMTPSTTSITFILPTYTPFTSNDVITIIYWATS